MTDLRLTIEDLDSGFKEEVRRLASRFVDMLPGSSEWSQLKYDAAVDGAYEAMEENILDLTVESLAEDAHTEWLNSLGSAA